MKIQLCRITLAAGLVLAVAMPAPAHHFFATTSDVPIAIAGKVVKFEMRNPHSKLVIETRDTSGNPSEWQIELGSIQALLGRGWSRDSLQPGHIVTVTAFMGRNRQMAAAREIMFPDGQVLLAGSHIGDRPRR